MPVAYFYVLPLYGEDWLKMGLSNDPLRRASEFSPRYFDLFDFERAFLVETEGRRDAARVELTLRHQFRAHRAPMPMHVRAEAGGRTEWLRGAYPVLLEAAGELQAGGHAFHFPARDWFRQSLGQRRQDLHSWASTALNDYFIDPEEPHPETLPATLAGKLRDAVAAFHHFGWNVGAFLPAALQHWYEGLQAPEDNSFTTA